MKKKIALALSCLMLIGACIGNAAYAAPSAGLADLIAQVDVSGIDTQNGNDQCAYFYSLTGNATLALNENDLTASFSQDSTLWFIRELGSDDMQFFLQPVEGKTNFSKIVLTLIDCADSQKTLTLTLDMTQNQAEFAGETVDMGDYGDILQLRYKNASGKFQLGDTVLFSCEKDDSGNDFSGFSAGVHLTVSFADVTGSSQIRLTRVNNQPLGHKNSTNLDMTEPTVAFTSALYITQHYGEQFDIPTYAAYDVLNDVKETSFKVEAPDGTVYTEPFTIDQYGKYKLSIIAKDTCGNTAKVTKIIFVNDDVAPELSVQSMQKTAYKVGDSVTVPGYTVSDNLNTYYVDVILFLPNSEIRLLTHEENGEVGYYLNDTTLYNANFCIDQSTFRAEQEGTYTIRYVAYDDQYNRTVSEQTFTVG